MLDRGRRTMTRNRLRAAAEASWIGFAFVITVVGILVVVCSVLAPSPYVRDFCQDWTSGRDFLAGYPVYRSLAVSLPVHFGSSSSACLSYNPHPPAAVLLSLGFSLWDYRSAYLGWSLLAMCCLVAALCLVVGKTRPGLTGPQIAGLLVLTVTSSALRHDMVQGQWNLPLLLLITGAWVADRRKAVATSGALIGVAAAIKLFPGFLVLYHLGARRWRGALAAAFAFLACNTTSWLIFGGNAFADYVTHAGPSALAFRRAPLNASVLGFWSRLCEGATDRVPPLLPWSAVTTLLTAVSFLAIVASAVVAVWGAKRRRDRDLAFAACTIAMLLASPLAWDHYFLTLTPSLWIVWQSCGCNRQAKAAVLASGILLFTVDPAWLLSVGRSADHMGEAWAGPCGTLVAASIPFCVLLGMYVTILKRLQGSRALATFRAGEPKTISPRPSLATTFLTRPAEAENAPNSTVLVPFVVPTLGGFDDPDACKNRLKAALQTGRHAEVRQSY